jgi:hypothetical protein
MTDALRSRVPAADECVLRTLLERWTAHRPDQVYLKLAADRELT